MFIEHVTQLQLYSIYHHITHTLFYLNETPTYSIVLVHGVRCAWHKILQLDKVQFKVKKLRIHWLLQLVIRVSFY